jgi:hypothetical protein
MRSVGSGLGARAAATIGLNPVWWFFLVYLVRHHNVWSFAIAVLGTAMGAAALQAAGLYCSRIRSGVELARDERLTTGDMIPVTIASLKEIIPGDLWLDLASARVEQSPLWRNVPNAEGNEVYVLIYRARTTDAPWTPGSAFLGSVGLRVAIVRDDPLSVKRAWSRFLLLHELAHVSSEGAGLQVARWRMLLTMLHAVITCVLLSTPFGGTLAPSAFVVCWACSAVGR